MGKKWVVRLVVEERDDCEPFDGRAGVAEFVRWKVADGVVLDVEVSEAIPVL